MSDSDVNVHLYGDDDLTKVINKVYKVLRRMETQFTEVSKSSQRTEKAVWSLGEGISKLSRKTSETETATKSYDASLKRLDSTAGKASRELKKTSKNIDKTGKEAKEADSSLDRLNKKFGNASRKTGTLGEKIEFLVGNFMALAGVLYGMSFPIREFANFEQKMAEVQAITGASGQAFQDLNDIAREMGRKTVHSAVNAADGLKYLAMAGLDVNEAITALPTALNLATAGMMQLGESADIVTNVMTGMGLAAEDLAHVGDVLGTTFTSSNVNLSELGTSMAYVAPLAAALEISVDELSAAIGLLGNAGIKGSRGGTVLRGVLARLTDPPRRAKKAMERLGQSIGQTTINITDASGEFLDLVDIVEQLEEANMSTADAVALFGRRAGPGMASLVSQGSDALRELTAANEASAGSMERIAQIQRDTLRGQFKIMVSQLKEVSIVFGEKLAPTLKSFMKTISDMAEDLGIWARENEKLIQTVAHLVAGITVLLATMAGFKLLTRIAGYILVPFAQTLIGIHTAATTANATLIGTLFPTLVKLTGALKALTAFLFTNPIGIAFGLITAAVVGGIAIFDKLHVSHEEFREDIEKNIDELEKWANSIDASYEKMKKFKNLLEAADTEKKFNESLENMQEHITEFGKKAKEEGKAGLAEYADAAAASIDTVNNSLKDGGKAIKEFNTAKIADEFETSAATVQEYGEFISDSKDRLKELNDEYIKLQKVGARSQFAPENVRIDETKGHFKAIRDEIDTTVKDMTDKAAEAKKVVQRDIYDLISKGAIDPKGWNVEEAINSYIKVAEKSGKVSQTIQEVITEAFQEIDEDTTKSMNNVVNKMIASFDMEKRKGLLDSHKMAKRFYEGLESIKKYTTETGRELETANLEEKVFSKSDAEDMSRNWEEMYFKMPKAARKYFAEAFGEYQKFLADTRGLDATNESRLQATLVAQKKMLETAARKMRAAISNIYAEALPTTLDTIEKNNDRMVTSIERRYDRMIIAEEAGMTSTADAVGKKADDIYEIFDNLSGDAVVTTTDNMKKVKAAMENPMASAKKKIDVAAQAIENRYGDISTAAGKSFLKIENIIRDSIDTSADLEEQKQQAIYAAQQIGLYQRLEALKEAQKKMEDAGQQNTTEYKKRGKEIKEVEDEITDNKKAEVDRRIELVQKELRAGIEAAETLKERREALNREQEESEMNLERKIKSIRREDMEDAEKTANIRKEIAYEENRLAKMRIEMAKKYNEAASKDPGSDERKELVEDAKELEESHKETANHIESLVSKLDSAAEKETQYKKIHAEETKLREEENEYLEIKKTQLDQIKNKLNEELKTTEQTAEAQDKALKKGAKDISISWDFTKEQKEEMEKFYATIDELQEKLDTVKLKIDISPKEYEAAKKAVDNIVSYADNKDMNLEILTGDSVKNINDVLDLIDDVDKKLEEDRTLKIESQVNEQQGGKIPSLGIGGAQSGKRIPGFGGGDKVKAMLEPGEWVIRKEAVRKFGDAFMSNINRGVLALGSMDPVGKMTEAIGRYTGGPIQKLATGGPSVASAGKATDLLQDFGRVELAVGNQRIPALVHTDVANQLKRAARREQLVGRN